MTTFENKCGILGEVFISFKSEDEFYELVAYNDLGFPLGYAISVGIVSNTDTATTFIEETWQALLDFFGIEEDTGFEVLDELFAASESQD